MIQSKSMWRNKKNGRPYQVIAIATDANNATDGRVVVVYISEQHALFVRAETEFLEKFEPI